MILANDFQRQWDEIGPGVLAAVARVGASGWYVLGEEVRRFEAALAAYWGPAEGGINGMTHAVGVASGLDALEIGLRVLGCGPGDRVLTTPVSAFPSTLAIVKLGAIPVFVDIDEYGLIDLERCRKVLQARPDIRYFLPVHLYGHALDMGEMRRLRDDFELKIVEDCAQSIGARFQGQATGTAGQVAITSFYPTKNLGAMGDGGALLTNDPALDAHARKLRFYGESARYKHDEIGYNSRLDEVHAAILHDACLPRLDRWIARRREIARRYIDGIEGVPGVPPGSESSWHLFPLFVDPAARPGFMDRLKAAGVTTGIHYPMAIPDQQAMQSVPHELADDCAIARRLVLSEVSLPIHPYLTDEEFAQVIAAANS